MEQKGIDLDVNAVEGEFWGSAHGLELVPAHFFYEFRRGLVVSPPPVAEGEVRHRCAIVEAPRPKNMLLWWIMSTLASLPDGGALAGYLKDHGFGAPGAEDPAEFEVLLQSVEKFSRMDLSPRGPRNVE